MNESSLEIGVVATGNRESIESLEQLAVDSLWVGGHVAAPNPSPEAMMGLSRLAALTERVKVGSSILLLPLYQPAIIAKQLADLDGSSRGRLVVGIGVGGEYPQEFRACGVPIAERGRRTDEMIPLIRRLWTAEEISHDGPFYPMTEVRIHPTPEQRGGPPIVVAGRSQAAMRRAATLGDGWFPYLYSPRRYAASVATVRAVATQVGRDLSTSAERPFNWYVWVFVNIADDGTEARQRAARSMGGTYGQDFLAMVDSVAAAGTGDEVLAKLKEFYDAGARHFVFCPATAKADQKPVIDRLFGEVVPALHEYANRLDSAQ